MTNRGASKSQEQPATRRSHAALLLVLVGSLLFGLFGLPRLGSRPSGAGMVAVDFSLPIVAGGNTADRVSLAALKGKVVVLDFWATWCGPCLEQAKIIERFVAGADPEVVVLGINEGESPEHLRVYFDRRPAPTYRILSDYDESVGQSYGVRGLPTLVVVGRDGRVTSSASGVVPYGRLERLVEEARGR